MDRSPGTTAARLAALSLLMFATACSRPQPPDKDQPPEPQAQGAGALRDAIQAPIDRAKAVSPDVLEAARKQRADIEAQTGGGDAPPAPQ